MERLQKFMANSGAGSRRKCEEWITAGLVTVNGEKVTELGTQVDPVRDEVIFRGKRIEPQTETVTIALHKPAGYVTTSSDQFGRPNVCQLVDIPGVRLYPVGRLDYQTTGLLLLTNDGDLAFRLTHPKHRIPKVYRAILKGQLTSDDLRRLENGVVLDDGYKTAKARVKLLSRVGNHSRVEFTIYEGKNHQVRRMARAVGHPVLRLQRVSEGGIGLEGLEEGKYRVLTPGEVKNLKSL